VAVPGIGPGTAPKVVAAAEQVRDALFDTLPFRIAYDPGDAAANLGAGLDLAGFDGSGVLEVLLACREEVPEDETDDCVSRRTYLPPFAARCLYLKQRQPDGAGSATKSARRTGSAAGVF